MNIKYRIICIIGFSTVLIGCGGPPDASPSNCAGKGMEESLEFYKSDEVARQAFLDKCEALKQEKK